MNDKDVSADSLVPLTIAALAAALAPETPPPELRAKVLERVLAAPTSVIQCAADGTWKPVMPGIEVKTLLYDAAAGAVSFFLRAQPNASFPAHRHTAGEECVVLSGEFTVGDVTLRAGDYLYAASGTDHPAATTRTGVLVYLRGSVADYPFAAP